MRVGERLQIGGQDYRVESRLGGARTEGSNLNEIYLIQGRPGSYAIAKSPKGLRGEQREELEAQVLERLAGLECVPRLFGREGEFLITEWVKGAIYFDQYPGLKALPTRKSDPFTFIECAKKGARALQSIHERGVMHGDLKETNLLFDTPSFDTGAYDAVATRRLFVIDYESAGTPQEIQGRDWAWYTAHYCSPERQDRGEVGFAADVWAYGVVLYYVLSGKHPFAGEESELQESIRSKTPQVPQGNDRLARLVMAMLEKDPRNRATLVQVIGELDDAQGSAEGMPHG